MTLCLRYFLKVLAVMAKATAKAKADGRMPQNGCELNGRARYNTQDVMISGMAAFLT